MANNAGKVALTPRGNYDATATYTYLDFVLYNGSSYVAKETVSGILPTDNTKWQMLAAGSTGGGGGGGAYIGQSATGAATAEKVVATANADFVLSDGAMVMVAFSEANTAANVTLNIDGTGAHAVRLRGAAMPSGAIKAGIMYGVIYDGNYYQMIGNSADAESYDGTQSGLNAATVQAAIDAIKTVLDNLSADAADIDYDNSTSGATATNTQDAIDEAFAGLENVSNDLTDLDGEVDKIKERMDTIIYGFHIDADESDPSPRVTYLEDAIGMTPAHMDYTRGVFDYGSWETAFFMPRPCMLRSNGTRDYYLSINDYTKKEDGVTASDVANTSYDGNAMMEWGQNGQKIWMKIVPDSSDPYSGDVYISNKQVDEDYHDYPFHNQNGVSVSHFYTPIYNGSLINSKLRSLSGQTVSGKLTADQERTYAKANGALWDIEQKADIDLINNLLILISKSTDSKTVFGQGLHTSGNETVNNGFKTGVHDAKGLFFGTNSGAAATYTNAVKVFGMENWWGFQCRRYVGHVMVNGQQKVKLTYGTEDGSTVTGFNLTGDGFKNVGATPSGTIGGYISKLRFSEDGMFPQVASGTATTYYCEGLWYNNGITAVPLRGGLSNNAAHAGALCLFLHDTASDAYWDVGAAPSCKPLA